MLQLDGFFFFALACVLVHALPANCLGTSFPNSTLHARISTSESPVTSKLATSGASSLSVSVDPNIEYAGSCGYIDASLGTPTTVVWQDRGSVYKDSSWVQESGWNTMITYAFAQSRLPPPKCCASCSIQASRVQVRFWPPETGPAAATTPAPKLPYTVVEDGFTYTSPSVYVAFSELYAQADCSLYAGGQIGNNVSSTIVAYAPDALSTAQCYAEGDGGFNGWKTINYTDWAHPVPNSVAMTRSGCAPYGSVYSMKDDPAGTNLVASPQFSLPQGISTLEPAWNKYGCDPWRYGALDPPKTLTKANAMAPSQAASATPAAQVSPPSSYITPVLTPSDPTKSKSDTQSGTIPALSVSEEPDLTVTPKSHSPIRSENDPTVSDPKPELTPQKPPAATQALQDPPQDPSSIGQGQNPDSADADAVNASPTQQAGVDPVLTVGSAAYEYYVDPSSNFVIASHTAQTGGPAVSVAGVRVGLTFPANSVMIDGTEVPIAVQSPAATALPYFTIGDEVMTANSVSQYIVHSQTTSSGAAAMVISDIPISLGSSADHVVVGSNTILLGMPSATDLPPITFGGQVITADSSSKYIINSHSLVPGAPAITISNTPISLAPSASQIVAGSSTIPLQQEDALAAPLFTLGNQIITADVASVYIVGSQTLVPGGEAVTISGVPISLAASAAQVVVGSSTISLKKSTPSIPTPIVANGQTITADSASRYIVTGQTLTPGAPAVIISRTPISRPIQPPLSMPIGSQLYPAVVDSAGHTIVASQTIVAGRLPLVVGGETISEAPNSSGLVVASGGSTTTEGLGQIIVGALGRTETTTGTVGANASVTGLTFTGGASKRCGALTAIVVGVVMMTYVVCFRNK